MAEDWIRTRTIPRPREFDSEMKGIAFLKFSIIASLLFFVPLIVLQGCTENPTAVGNQYVDTLQVPHIRIDTLYATSHGTSRATINTEGTDRILLGRYPSYDAIAMLRFTGISTAISDTATITSASLQLHAVYHFGDSLAPIAFSAYRAIALWDTTSYDSLTIQPGSYYSTTPVSVVPPTIVDDTSVVSVPLDTAVVNSWFTPAGSLVNYGIVLKATNVSTVKGFGSFNHAVPYNRPALVINYVSGGNPGTFVVTAGISRFVANIGNADLILNPNLMYVQAGVSYRGQLYFNLQSLPKAAQILRADLELMLDRNDSRLNFYTSDSLYSDYVRADSALVSPRLSQSLSDNLGRKFYRFSIPDYVRLWASSTNAQHITFSAFGEINSLDLFTFYGTLSAPDLRPRLIITSTYLNQ